MTIQTVAFFPLALALACGSATQADTNASPPTPTPTTTPDATKRSALERIEAIYTAWNAHDEDGVFDQYAPGAMSSGFGQATPSPPKKVEEDRAWLAKIWSIYPKGREEAVLILSNGNRSAHLWRVETGAGHSFIGATLATHAPDGRITNQRAVLDSLTLSHQWGVRQDEDAPDSEPAWAELVRAVSTGSATEAANIELLGKFTEAWNDAEAIAPLLADDYIHRALPNKKAMTGAELKAFFIERTGKVRTTVETVGAFAAGDWVVNEGRLTMHFLEGEFAGRQGSFDTILFAEVRGGKIVRTIGAFNQAQGLVSLGAMTAEEFDAIEARHLEKLKAGASR